MFLTILVVLITFSMSAQIKVHENNHISLGSLTLGWGVQIQPNGYTYFQPSVFNDYGWMNLTYAPNQWSKSYIVNYSGSHKFFVYGNGQIYSNGQWYGSDSSFKTNIQRLDSSLFKILRLQGIAYDLKDDKPTDTSVFIDNKGNKFYSISGSKSTPDSSQIVDSTVLSVLLKERNRKYYGLIAQDVEKVVPEVVRTMPDGTKAVAYQSIVPILIEAIKTQQSEIQELYMLISDNMENNVQWNSSPTKNENKTTESNVQTKGSFLFQNEPNPFSLETRIRFNIDSNASEAVIYLFSIQGNLLKEFRISDKNQREIIIHGDEFNAGIYLYTLWVDGKEVASKRMILTN